ncbi:MAG: aromatic ring-hydroxylating dioxygenase subunit alpha [Opitutaceae bacterium]|nr:aromatic ring-hydroxylating dioxygenase subunit alpha [Opitutaceae bacterium]
MTPSLASLRPHWFVACTAAAVGARPLPRTILGVPIVLFRAAGKIAALIDRCPHRNAALSQGRVTGDLIECPYHGWAFDAGGVCRRIPGLPAACEHPHQAAEAVRVAEREGLVWVWVGKNEATPEAFPPNRHVALGDLRFDTFLWAATAQCALLDGVENLLDACHPHFAHAGLVRRAQKRRTVGVNVRRDAEGVEAIYQENARPDGLIPRLMEGRRQTSIGRFFPPGTAQLEYTGPAGPQFLLTSMFTPCDERTVLIHSCISTPRKMAPAWLKKSVLRAVFGRVLRQDQDVLRRQQENIDRFGGAKFTSTPLDVMRPHLLYFINHPEKADRSDYATTLTMEL